MATQRAQGQKGVSTPPQQPEGPPSLPTFDHSFTLQAVMEMQKELGTLGQKIEGMREDLRDLKQDAKETREKVTEVEKSISIFKGARLALGAFGALALVVIGALLNHFIGK